MIREFLDGLFYRRLWLKAEADRRAADVANREIIIANREMSICILDLLEALDLEDHSDPEVRGVVRKLRQTVR